jgi:GT2 family glycosyltransferase
LKEPVTITIVTFNSARYIAGCLEHALAQDYARLHIVVVDNASRDSTVEILRTFEKCERITILYNRDNTGFAAGQNQAIAAAGEVDWILTLNPDVRLRPDFVRILVTAGTTGTDIGTVCGKLLAASPEFQLASPPLLDSTGIYFTPSLRHLDRGNRVPDEGQYDAPEYVFGATAAACLYRTAMIRDIEVLGEFFDSDFFAYREDADIAWRAQLFGWRCLYTPAAVALHVRTVVPESRGSLPAIINLHSVKNRWLLRIKNTTANLYRHFWLPITLRDIVVIGGCLLREWSSLPAFLLIMKLWPRTWQKRCEIMRRKRISNARIRRWFSNQPVSEPAVLLH